MDLTAINVLLDPDADTVENAQAVNARLREDYPDGFALDANHAPHITILQRFVRTADLDEVANAVAEVLRAEQSMNWECNATGYYALADKDLRYRADRGSAPTSATDHRRRRTVRCGAGDRRGLCTPPRRRGDQPADSGLREQLRRTPHRHELPPSSDRRDRYP